MNQKKSKAPLALIEQLIMILVFAVASIICVQGFVYANRLSQNSERKEIALEHIQEVTEYCKAKVGDWEQICDVLPGKITENGIQVMFEDEIKVVVTKKEDGNKYLQKAEIVAYEKDGDKICGMDIAWQKEGTDE